MNSCSVCGVALATRRKGADKCRAHRVLKGAGVVCSVDGCEKNLRSDNKTGNCSEHRGLSEYSREYARSVAYKYVERRAVWIEANAERLAAYKAAWFQENKERLAVFRVSTPAEAEGKRRYKARKRNVYVSTPSRAEIWARTGGQCHLCLKPIEFDSAWHADHVVPVSQGGIEHPENLAATHAFCNQSKYVKTCSSIAWIEKEALEVCGEFHAQ